MPAGSDVLIWKEKYRVPSYAIGANGQVKFYYISNFLLDMASIHADHLHWGFRDMRERNQYWVLSRFHVIMHKYPGMHETIHLETWPKGINRLFALRDYRISDAANDVICVATSAWLIMDAGTGKPVRIADYRNLFDYTTNMHGIEEVPDKLPAVTVPDFKVLIKVACSDLDINKHVNSGKYIEWIEDTFDTHYFEQKNIREFQINFLSETRFGETIELVRMPGMQQTDYHYFEGTKESDHSVSFRASIIWDKSLINK